jgi:2-iminobutanoate/2-iminopropanoate deaminase
MGVTARDTIGRTVRAVYAREDESVPDFEFLHPAAFGPSGGPFSQGVRAGSLVFMAGQAAVDDDGNVIAPGDVREQTRVTLDRIAAVLAEAGGDLTDVVTATAWLTDLSNFAAYNEAWVEKFGDHRPARATVRADLVLDGMLVEVQAIAVV